MTACATGSDSQASATSAWTATTTVRVHYPAGASITLRGGGPLAWDRDASTSASGDVYTFTSDAISSRIELKPLASGAWAKGPNFAVNPGESLDIYPRFHSDSGHFERAIEDFGSSHLREHRGIWVYVPPSYDENTAARYPVLYMCDGQSLFPNFRNGDGSWHVDQALDDGARDGSIREAIVVGIDSSAGRMNELTPTRDPDEGQGGNAGNYLAMVVDEIKPMIDRTLRTKAGREDTAIIGSSLGGVFAVYASSTRSDVFGLAGVMSPATWWDNEVVYRIVDGAGGASLARVYVDSGDSGTVNDDVGYTADLVHHYEGRGYVHTRSLAYVVGRGDTHTESAWARRLPGALRFILGPR